ncbi:MAG: DUF2868 domain-containing protein [Planctomycetota bacterium]|nr:MAG: DUF2868 domain-containing protein [Planctomycetota bacterium]
MAHPSPARRLAELADLEVVLARREAGEALEAPPEEAGRALLAREGLEPDEALARLPRDPALRRALAAELLGRLRAAGAALPGERVAAGHRAAGWVLAVVGLLLGSAAARAALAFHGAEPINVWAFLGGLVLLQVLLLVVLLVALAGGLARGLPLLGAAQRAARALGRLPWLDRLARHTPERARAAFAALDRAGHRAAGRQSLYRGAERWLLLGLTQRFGVFFNLGAAGTFLALVLFTDLAFAWSTTPAEIDGGHLEALVRALALPWAWLLPGTVPGREAIEATRWSRLEHAFAGGDVDAAAAHAAAWWSFLFLALLVWGLLPRLLAWALAAWRLRRELAAARLDDAATLELLESALPAPAAGWHHPDPAAVAGERLAPTAGVDVNQDEPSAAAGEEVAVVLWGGWSIEADRLADALAAHRGWRPAAVHKAGGPDEAATRAVLERLGPAAPLALLAEGGEPPDKRLGRFLAGARERLGERALVSVVLVELDGAGGLRPAAAEDVDLWRAALARRHDPYLRVEALRR